MHDFASEDTGLKYKQRGFIGFGAMTLIIGGLALAGLLVYGWQSGQDLPLWPAIAVVLVNVVGAAKIVVDTKKARQQQPTTASSEAKAAAGKRSKRLGK